MKEILKNIPDAAWIVLFSGVALFLAELGIGLISWFN